MGEGGAAVGPSYTPQEASKGRTLTKEQGLPDLTAWWGKLTGRAAALPPFARRDALTHPQGRGLPAAPGLPAQHAELRFPWGAFRLSRQGSRRPWAPGQRATVEAATPSEKIIPRFLYLFHLYRLF